MQQGEQMVHTAVFRQFGSLVPGERPVTGLGRQLLHSIQVSPPEVRTQDEPNRFGRQVIPLRLYHASQNRCFRVADRI